MEFIPANKKDALAVRPQSLNIRKEQMFCVNDLFVYGLTCLLFVLVAAELGTQPVMLFHEFTAELALDGFQPEELARR